MDKMNELKNKFDNYGKILTNEYLSGGSLSKRKRLVFDLYWFTTLYSYIDKNKIFDWEKDSEYVYLSERLFIENLFGFLNFTNNATNDFNLMANSVINIFKDVEFPFYKNCYTHIPKITDKERYDIIMSFLNNYDEKVANKFIDKVRNLEVFFNKMEDNTGGYIIPIDKIKKTFIILNDDFNNCVYTTSHLIHEFGHSMELDLLYNCDRNYFNFKNKATPFYEVSSSFFEYSFLRYLKDNKLFEFSTDLSIYHYYLSLFTHCFDLKLITDMSDDLLIDSEFNVILSNEDVMKEAELFKERINYYDLVECGEELNFMNPFLYGLGEYLSIILYDKYKDNPNEFKKNFRKFLLEYPNSNDLSCISLLDVNKNDLFSGKILKKTLNNYIDNNIL